MKFFTGHDVRVPAHLAGLMNKLSLIFARFSASLGELADYATVLDLPSGATAPEWVQLLPLGKIEPSPLDGRAAFELTNADKVVEASRKFLRTMSIDYDHGTDESGGSSRAAGWIVDLAAKGPNGEPGIWGRVNWTEGGARAVQGHEYRFLSPSLYHDKNTREVRFIVRAALTNNPALVLKALASIQTEEQSSMELVKKLAAMLGLDPNTATESDVIAAIEAMAKSQPAVEDMANKDKKLCSIAKAAGHEISDASKIDETMVSAICKTITGASDVTSLREQLADAKIELMSLRQTKDARTPEQIVDDLVAKGAITPAAKSEALEIYKLSPAKFEAMIDKLGVATLATRIAPTTKTVEGGDGALDEGAVDVCAKFGIETKDFAKTDKELANMRESHQ